MSEETDKDAFHFVAYIPFHGRVYELDGLREGPVDHGGREREGGGGRKRGRARRRGRGRKNGKRKEIESSWM